MAEPNQLVDPKTIVSVLEKMKSEMEAALPKHITADRMARIALTAMRQNPKLFQCTRDSFLGSLLTASTLGLEPGVLGRSYLVPYFDHKQKVSICQFIPGWRGMMDLVNRAGQATAWTHAVYDGDEFDYGYGDRPFVHHKDGPWKGEENALMFVYAVGRLKEMEFPNLEVWPVGKIWKHRDRFNKVGDQHYSYKHPEMYARKIPLLQVIKYLPASVEMATASALDLAASEGKQRLTLEGSIRGQVDDSSVQEAEIERLLESLQWEEAKRQDFRDGYSGRPAEALDYLQKEVAKAKGASGARTQGNGKPEIKAADKPAQDTKPAQEATQAQPKQEAQRVEKKGSNTPEDWFA